jgi:hypothetical protein
MCNRSKSVAKRVDTPRSAVSVEPLEGRWMMSTVYSVNIVGYTSPTAPTRSGFFDVNLEVSAQGSYSGNLTALGSGGGQQGAP